MPPRRRLDPTQRRAELVAVGAELFAARPYDEVLMEEVAARAGVSRALLYKHFPSKRDLFEAVYRKAAEVLLVETEFDSTTPVIEQVAAGLDTHFDYFVANRNTVLAANRTLAGDPVIQAVINEELAALRQRIINASGLSPDSLGLVSAALAGWLVFVRVVCVEWLVHQAFSRDELRQMCVGALLGALSGATDLSDPR
ncbi:TetR/AcrR family transcriptional regulator [Kutzneria sp. NPDC051319]|uniref:TetR/AcrR family transcriptional regulator n=1 Tax=Kutzneria sp. NPDC051319 TaxID=3155047 RepID=UPI00343A825A